MKSITHNINVFDVTKEFADKRPPMIHSDKNGFFLCRRGSVTLSLDDNIFEVSAGTLYIYPPFSQTFIKYVSDDMQGGVIGVADFEFVLSSVVFTTASQQQIYIRNRPCVSLSVEQQVRLEEMITVIRRKLNEPDTIFSTQILSTLTQAICFEMLDAYFSGHSLQPVVQVRRDKIFHRFMHDVYENFRQHRNVFSMRSYNA